MTDDLKFSNSEQFQKFELKKFIKPILLRIVFRSTKTFLDTFAFLVHFWENIISYILYFYIIGYNDICPSNKEN